MARQLILLARGDQERASAVIDAFARRTGLAREAIQGGARFPLHGDDHAVKVVETLDQIDPGWSEHVALGDPESE